MITVLPVTTRKQRKEFLDFPLKLYKGCPYYAPNLYSDEAKIFDPNYFYYQTCDAKYWNAYRDGKMVGRIGGILQKAANKKWGQKRVRFTRFDLIDDLAVAKALLGAVEDWARSLGMEEVFGPMGFSDLEREGLLIEGFEEPTTISENYNYAYYQTLLEQLGYTKDVDYFAHQVTIQEGFDISKVERIVNKMMAREKLHLVQMKSTSKLLDRYGPKFFDIVEHSYDHLYQTVPFIDDQIKDAIESFKLILSTKYICLIVDENDDIAAFGLCFPHITPILNKTGGHLYPWILPQLLYRLKNPDVIEFGLIGVADKYKNSGIAWAPMIPALKMFQSGKIKYAETNLNLETNLDILNLFTHFNTRRHRKVRTFIRKI